MFEPVYVTRWSESEPDGTVEVVLAEIGIVKIEGCYVFEEATKDADGEYGYFRRGTEVISQEQCQKIYGSVPAAGDRARAVCADAEVGGASRR